MESSSGHPNGAAQDFTRRDVLKMLGVSAAGLLSTPNMDRAAASKADMHDNPAKVAIAQSPTYDPKLVRAQVQSLLDSLGGISDIVRPGDRVAIKVNLTGGTSTRPLTNISPIESYVTHPQVVQALGELLRDAGASRLYIVEAIFDPRTYSDWGYLRVAQALDATLVDLNCPDPYADFAHVPVGHRWSIYRNFVLNQLLEEVDTFISVAKMKCHWWAGVTLSMKNLVGLVPAMFYNSSPQDRNRSAFHGDESVTDTRLPHIICDLNQARPIDLALIDGIKTVEGGEGPWIPITQANAGVLVAGKNAVATDAVSMAAMGFDPQAEMPNAPFIRGLNHLNLACGLGLGTNRLSEIEVLGASIEAVTYQFTPCYPPVEL